MLQASVWHLCIKEDILRPSDGVVDIDGGLGAVGVAGELEASKSTTCMPGGMVDFILAFFCLCSSLSRFPSLVLHFECLAPKRRNFNSNKRMRCWMYE